MSAARQLKSNKEWFPELADLLDKAADDYGLPESSDWNELADLSSLTKFEGIDVYGDAAIKEKNQYVAPGSVFVELVYDSNSKDPISFHDSYPIRVFFKLLNKDGQNRVEIKKIEVDTSSFFE